VGVGNFEGWTWLLVWLHWEEGTIEEVTFAVGGGMGFGDQGSDPVEIAARGVGVDHHDVVTSGKDGVAVD